MANPYHFYYAQTSNVGSNNGFFQPSSAHPTEHPPDYIHRLHQQAQILAKERQNYYALCVQLEEEKRTMLAWNSRLERENAALKDEITQLKQQQNNENGKKDNEQQTENNGGEAKGKRSHEMNSLEMIEALIGNVQNERPLTNADGNGTTKDGHLAIGISEKMRKTMEAKPTKENEHSADDNREFGQQIEQIISTILDNHSLPFKKRRQSMSNDLDEQQQHIGSANYQENGAVEEDIECIGSLPLCASSSMSGDAKNEFPPPPKTPPPPVTPPLPPQQLCTFSAETFERELQTTSEPNVSVDHQPPLADDDLTNAEKDGQRGGAADAVDRGPDEGGGGGKNGEEDVLFVDDVCRNKWVPSMAKREPRTEWAEIVMDEEEGMEEAAGPNNTINISSTTIEMPQRVKEEMNG